MNRSIAMFTCMVAASTLIFEIVPENTLPIVEWGGYEGIAFRPTQDHNFASIFIPIIYTERIARSIYDIRKKLVRLHIAEIIITEAEYMRLRKLQKEWDVDIAEFCKYCVLSITEAHSG